MDGDDTDYATEAPLPIPGGTPYRTPMNLSRHPSRNPTPSPSPSPYPLSSSPPTTAGRASPMHRVSMSHQDPSFFDETISILDPRRFTPTLHANLVAEILSLRRDLESKASLIDELENDLHTARSENEIATSSAATALREARDVKRQLARVDNDGAVEAVAQERDEANVTVAELRRQVERLTKGRRTAEDDFERIKVIADRDGENFKSEKRQLERRAHVAEGRLKALLDEIAAANAIPQPHQPTHSGGQENEDMTQSEVAMSDTASIRTMSIRGRPSSLMIGDDEAERLGVRFSMLAANTGGLSLADELDLDGSESDESESSDTEAGRSINGGGLTDAESEAEPEELPEYVETGTQADFEQVQVVDDSERAELLHSLQEKSTELKSIYVQLDQKTTDLEGTYDELDKANEKVAALEGRIEQMRKETVEMGQTYAAKEEKYAKDLKIFEIKGHEAEQRWLKVEEKVNSFDRREQMLEEKSKGLEEREKRLLEKEAKASPVSKEASNESFTDDDTVVVEVEEDKKEYEANQRRKRSAGIALLPTALPGPPAPIYVSVESQTVEEPPTPVIPPRSPTPPPIVEVITQTIGTQTDAVKPPPLIRIIPTIAVTPPPPPTPPLPPMPKPVMKDAAVQTRSPRTKSHSMQTEEIKIDQREIKLPPHLLPSAVLGNNAPVILDAENPPPSPPRKSTRRSVKRYSTATVASNAPRSAPTESIYSSPKPIDYDSPEKDNVRRHLFTSMDLSNDLPQSSGEDEFHDDLYHSDSEFQTALSAPRPRKQRNSQNLYLCKPDKPLQRTESVKRKNSTTIGGLYQRNRERSPSLTSNRTTESGHSKVGPPFPVPTRGSSRKVSAYGSDRTESPTPMSAGMVRDTHRTYGGRQQSIRKVRSAAALPRSSGARDRSPPPLSVSSAAPDSPSLPPPLPRDEIVSPSFDRHKFGTSRNKHHRGNNTANTANESIGGTIAQTSVVDAIAQTMVGEWMWKYVRRRRSFGVSETSPQDGRDESSAGGGQRHKRWVWLAPYERAVMWSSRQPTSGSALLGKSGRKLPIQSVLDVKDDTPLPKNAASQPLFNRSILILTPARALKFTASSRERHYVWLTALSFLSHSPQGNEGLLALPPPMPFEYDHMDQQHQQEQQQSQHQQHYNPPPPPPIPTQRETPFNPIRDSIRVAKGKGKGKSRIRVTEPIEATTYTTPVANTNSGIHHKDSTRDIRELERYTSPDGNSVAEPPSVPRFPGEGYGGHRRRRSNTGGRPGTNRSASYTNGYNQSVHSSYGGSANSDYYGNGTGVGGVGLVSGNSSVSHGISGHGSGWEAGPVGTVRMEAFVERKPRFEFDEEDEYSRPSSYRLRRDRRSSRQESYWSGSGDFYGGSHDNEEFYQADDPFRGF